MVTTIRILLTMMLFCAIILPDRAIAQGVKGESWTEEDLKSVEDGHFRCPESLSTLAQKTREMENFLAWTRSRYPNWGAEQIIAFRMAVLKHNACMKTIDNIRRSPD